MERRVYGTETEYGLSLETRGQRLPRLDPGVLFSHLERVLVERYRTLEGDSFGRNPLAGGGGPIRIQEGRFLESGARVYYDAGHVEWATPEACSPQQAVLYEQAGDRSLTELAAAASFPRGSRLLLVKNNVDYAGGATYGCHENYLVERRPEKRDGGGFLAAMIGELVPFLVTRQIYCGGGKLGGCDPRAGLGFQISQRADYIDRIASTSTRGARAIVNTRDESLGDAARHRRLHLILGDSNRSPHAALLKLGATGLVLRLIEERVPGEVPELAEPLAALRTVSRDLTCTAALPLRQGGSRTAIEVQRLYLERAERRFLAGGDAPTRQVLAHWRSALDDLAQDPLLLSDRADWAIKLRHLHAPRLARARTGWPEVGAWGLLFARLRRDDGGVPEVAELHASQLARHQFLIDRHRLRWSDYAAQRRLHFELRELDLRYHDLDPEHSVFSLLEGAGAVRCGPDPAAVAAAQREPPAETRARARAEVIRWAHGRGWAGSILLDWGRVGLPAPVGDVRLDDPLAPSNAALSRALLQLDEAAATPRRDGGGAAAAEVPIRVLAVEPVAPEATAAGAVAALLKTWRGR